MRQRDYWEDWANDIADIAETPHHPHPAPARKPADTQAREAFDGFLDELRDDLNATITEADAIEMLAQHLITRPVFDALFDDYEFTEHNPVSRAMQRMLDVLDEPTSTRKPRPRKVLRQRPPPRPGHRQRRRPSRRVVVELYDKFFRTPSPD